MRVIIASVRPTVATASGPTRETKKTSTTANTDSSTSSSTIGIASSTIARSMEPSVYEPWWDPASDSRIVFHRLAFAIGVSTWSPVMVLVRATGGDQRGKGRAGPYTLGSIGDRIDLDAQALAGQARDLHG